jgi:hypothetical protein
MHPRLRGVCFKWRCGNTFGFLIQPPFSLTKKINYTAKVWHNWCDVIILSNRAQLQESSCRRMTLLYAVSRAVKLRICAKLPHVEYMLTSATWIPLSDSQVLCKWSVKSCVNGPVKRCWFSTCIEDTYQGISIRLMYHFLFAFARTLQKRLYYVHSCWAYPEIIAENTFHFVKHFAILLHL